MSDPAGRSDSRESPKLVGRFDEKMTEKRWTNLDYSVRAFLFTTRRGIRGNGHRASLIPNHGVSKVNLFFYPESKRGGVNRAAKCAPPRETKEGDENTRKKSLDGCFIVDAAPR